MARPIKATPLLSEQDWNRLEKAMANIQPVPQQERKRIKQSYELAKSRATFYMP